MEKCWLDGRTLAGQSGVGWLEDHWLDKGVLIARSGVDWMGELSKHVSWMSGAWAVGVGSMEEPWLDG